MHKIKNLLMLVARSESSQKEKKTQSGIIIPNSIVQKDVPLRGVVVEIGKGTKTVPMEVKIGETITYKRDAVITDIDGFDLVSQDSVILIEEGAGDE